MNMVLWLPPRERSVKLATADDQTRAHVEEALKVMDRHRGMDWHRGYAQGKTDGLLMGIASAVVVAGALIALFSVLG
jgi:hypothetical protein